MLARVGACVDDDPALAQRVRGQRRVLAWQLALWGLGRRRRYRVAGTSMEPALRAGDHLFVAPQGRSKFRLAPGNVVLLRHPHQPGLVMVKRVVRLKDGGLWVRGDNPYSTDSRHFGVVPLHCVLGLVTGYIGRGYGSVPGFCESGQPTACVVEPSYSNG